MYWGCDSLGVTIRAEQICGNRRSWFFGFRAVRVFPIFGGKTFFSPGPKRPSQRFRPQLTVKNATPAAPRSPPPPAAAPPSAPSCRKGATSGVGFPAPPPTPAARPKGGPRRRQQKPQPAPFQQHVLNNRAGRRGPPGRNAPRNLRRKALSFPTPRGHFCPPPLRQPLAPGVCSPTPLGFRCSGLPFGFAERAGASCGGLLAACSGMPWPTPRRPDQPKPRMPARPAPLPKG